MLRIILIFIIVFLVVRIFVNIGREVPYERTRKEPEREKPPVKKGVPRELGEYVDFEEVGEKR